MTEALFTTASIITFAAIDRLWGAPKGKTAAKVLAGLTVAGLFLLDWRLAAMGAAIVIGRSIGFADGVATGKNISGLLMRSHVPALLALALTGGDVVATACLLPLTLAAILLALWYGHRIDQDPGNVQRALDDNTRVELTRGAFAGLGVGLYALTRSL